MVFKSWVMFLYFGLQPLMFDGYTSHQLCNLEGDYALNHAVACINKTKCGFVCAPNGAAGVEQAKKVWKIWENAHDTLRDYGGDGRL